MDNPKVILIGGSSHCGKSTLAQYAATKFGWRYFPTDYIARHPGRPWKTPEKEVPPHVAEHYSTLSVDELIEDVLAHYQRLWPTIESTINEHTSDDSKEGLVIEGSALWPESVSALNLENIAAVWLTASDELFRSRIYSNSHFDEATAQEKILIQKFQQRTCRYNEKMMESVQRLGLDSINIDASPTQEELLNKVLESWYQRS